MNSLNSRLPYPGGASLNLPIEMFLDLLWLFGSRLLRGTSLGKRRRLFHKTGKPACEPPPLFACMGL